MGEEPRIEIKCPYCRKVIFEDGIINHTHCPKCHRSFTIDMNKRKIIKSF